ncbi:Uncharacterized membrane protein [Devosia enhydra]|uniref:Uncharacterized membrane protein n=1 Tax=Devosia enhydra TaxID=665118 RepID=A0A1K2HYM2_9HYPH|nr:DUF2244 domain-containing protein [Devosia enhydra]SFZ85025.1 Uncharacterized membrane protein [Devosia enhydra]
MSTTTQARPLFAAKLTPHNSLTGNGQRIVIAVMVVMASVPGMVFFSMGAWPIVGFMGLDILAVWWALSAARRNGRAFEEVTLWRHQLDILKVDGKGQRRSFSFNPLAVRLVIDRDINERTRALHLRGADQTLEIGAFLAENEKSSFAKAFGTALRQARR